MELTREEREYIIDLKFFYNMTEKEAEQYYSQIRYNESRVEDRINNARGQHLKNS